MKAKVTRGNNFRRLMNYLLGETKKAEIVGGNLEGRDAKTLATQLETVAALRPGIQKPVVHFSLSAPEGEYLSDDQWRKVSERFLILMGFDLANTPYIALRHRDKKHDHIHIAAPRVSLTGSLWYGHWEAVKAIKATQQLEQEFGLTITTKRRDRKLTTKAEREIKRRTGGESPRVRLQELVDEALEALQGPVSARAFAGWLENHGVSVRANIAKTGRMNGFSYEIDGIHFKSSQLGKKYTYDALNDRGLKFEKEDISAFIQGKLTEEAKASLINPKKKKKKKSSTQTTVSKTLETIGADQGQELQDASSMLPEKVETDATRAESPVPPAAAGTQAQEVQDASSMPPEKVEIEATRAESPAPVTTGTTPPPPPPQPEFPPSSPKDEAEQDERIRKYEKRLQEPGADLDKIFIEMVDEADNVTIQMSAPELYRAHMLQGMIPPRMQEGYKTKLLALADRFGWIDDMKDELEQREQSRQPSPVAEEPAPTHAARRPEPEKPRGRGR